MTCTVAGLAKYLHDNIVEENGKWVSIPCCDFCIIDNDDCSLKEVHQNASGWYGLKPIDAGFNSSSLMVVADYYGGGCAHMAQLWPNHYVVKALTDLIVDTLSEQEFARPDTLLLVEFSEESSSCSKENKNNYIVRLSASMYGTVRVQAHSENEAKSMAFAMYESNRVEWQSQELTDVMVEQGIC